MKSVFTILSFFILVHTAVQAQEKSWSIRLEAKGTITTEQFDSILEKGPEFAYDLFDSFGLMDGLYKYQIQLEIMNLDKI